jgi:superfamily II DNA helicase RecQ
MPFQFYRVSIHNMEDAAEELNAFLSAHCVISVDRQLIENGENSYWLFCIEYSEQQAGSSRAKSAGVRRKGGVDYRELLSEDDFQTYLGLKEFRKQVAEEENIAVYLVFTNNHLAKIAERDVRTLEELRQIEGIGKSRIEKYGDRVIKWLTEYRGDKDEAGGEPVPEDSRAEQPAAGSDQGAEGETPAS